MLVFVVRRLLVRRRRHGRRRRARLQRLLRLPARAGLRRDGVLPPARRTTSIASSCTSTSARRTSAGSASSRSRRSCAPSFPADLSLVAGGLVVGAAAGVALGAVAQQRRGTLVARGARRLRGLRHERAGLLGRGDDGRLLPPPGGRDRAPADQQAQHLQAADRRSARVAAVAVAAVDHPRPAAGRHHHADDARVAAPRRSRRTSCAPRAARA